MLACMIAQIEQAENEEGAERMNDPENVRRFMALWVQLDAAARELVFKRLEELQGKERRKAVSV